MKGRFRLLTWIGLVFASFSLLVGALGSMSHFVPLETAAANTAYKTVTFSSTTMQSSINDYESEWDNVCDSLTLTLGNFNNNKKGWAYVKCGRKDYASVGTITTADTIDLPITEVVVTVDASTPSKINSATLEVASDSSFTSNKQTITYSGSFGTGDRTFSVTTPTANRYYRLVFDCASGSSNGLITISKIVFNRQVVTYGITTNAASDHWTWRNEADTAAGPTTTSDPGQTKGKIVPASGYALPDSLTTATPLGKVHYNNSTGVVTIDELPGAAVVIEAAMIVSVEYTITVNETNSSHTGDSSIFTKGSASLSFTASSGCYYSKTISVTGAEYTWSKTSGSGTLALSNPTSDVVITVAAASKQLDYITVAATKTSFKINDSFSFAGTITAYDNDESSATVPNDDTNLSFSGYDPFTSGSQTVTVDYKGKTDTYGISVGIYYVYQRITSTSDIDTDGAYLIVCEASDVVMKLAADSDNQDSVSIADHTIAENATINEYEFTLSVNNVGKYAVGDSSDKYIYRTSDSNGLSVDTNINYDNTISFSDGNVNIVGSGGAYLRYNSGSSWFRYYTSATYTNQKAIQLYKKVPSTVVAAIVGALANPNKNYYEGGTLDKNQFSVQTVTKGGVKASTTDFTVGSHTLVLGSNTITLTYAPGGVATLITTEVNVTALSHGDASVISVSLVEGEGVVHDYYYASGIEWDLTGLSVLIEWDDSSLDDSVLLQSLVDSGDATIDPVSPEEDTTSFTVTYTYEEVDITDNVVLVTMHEDEASSISWTSRGTVDCFAGTTIANAVDTSRWSFTVSWKSGKADSNLDVSSVGTGADQIHLGLYASALPASEGTPLALNYAFSTSDDGLYLVAFYKSANTRSNSSVTITPLLNSIRRESAPGAGYFRIDDVSELSDDDTIIFAELSESTSLSSMKAYGGSSNFRGTSTSQTITGSLHRITPNTTEGSETGLFTVDKLSSNTFAFIDANEQYVYASSNSDNHMKTKATLDDNGTFLVSITNGSCSIVAQGTNSHNTMRYNPNAGSPIFSCYTTGQKDIAIYKYMSSTPAAEYANNKLKVQKAILDFANYFNEQMDNENVCGAATVNPSSSAFTTAWSNVANRFDALFVDENTGDDEGTYGTYKLTPFEVEYALDMFTYGYATWTNDTRSGTPGVARDPFQQALKTYDYVVTQYELTPFLSDVRTPSSAAFIPKSFNKDQSPLTTTLWIVLASGLAGLGAIGVAYAISKRRRHNEVL